MFWSVVISGLLTHLPAAQDERPMQQKSLYQQIITRTTGNNGYEEYVRAADMLQQLSAKNRVMSYDRPPQPGEAIPQFLQVRREAISKGQPVLDLVRAGNRKPVYEPREKLDAATSFPEYAQFKNIAKLFVAESYVRYANGNPLGGLGSLLDGLTLSHKMSQTTVISALVSIACQNILLSSASDRLGQMSEAEAQHILAFSEELIKQPDPVLKAIHGEREYMKANLDALLKHPKDLQEWTMGDDDDNAVISRRIAELSNMGPQQKSALIRGLGQRLDDSFTELLRQYSLPPSKWESVEGNDYVAPKDAPLEDYLFGLLEPGFLKQTFVASGRQRAQIALFRAHAAIIRFKWHNNRLPARLEELGLPEYVKDPLSDGDFVYELKGNGVYELYSQGYKSTGPVHLRYQPPPGLGGSKDVEPPLVGSGL